MANPCMNCGDPDARPYDLLVRSSRHEGTFLCDVCHTALEEHTADD